LIGFRNKTPRAIILEPTRDLAAQVIQEIEKFGKYITSPSILHSLCVGGTDGKTIKRQLKEGVDIVVGTPGKMMEMIRSGVLDVSHVMFYVIDEADSLVEQGNMDMLLEVFDRIPKARQRLQILMFSATLHSDEVKELAKKITKHPILIDLKGKGHVPEVCTSLLSNGTKERH
jgi:ATP-dependent RNA helicase DDX1